MSDVAALSIARSHYAEWNPRLRARFQAFWRSKSARFIRRTRRPENHLWGSVIQDEDGVPPQEELNRILLACEKTGREQPPLSFMATILVDRVAREVQEWLDQGKLTSVYNLTQIAEDETKER